MVSKLWCTEQSLGSLLERGLSGSHPRNSDLLTQVGIQESPLEFMVVLILTSSDHNLRKYWFRGCEGESILTLERKLKTVSHQIHLHTTARRTKVCLF